MKKLFTLSFILTVFYTTSFAQQYAPQKGDTEFGITVGYNSSYVSESSSSFSSDAVSGFNVGASVDYYFSDRWSIKAKLNYDQKGWGNGFLNFPDGTTADGVDFKLNYITIPVMANWHFGRTRNWYLNFGPYVGILMNASESYDNTAIKDGFNTTDVGLALGIGVKIPISDKAKFLIEYDGQAGFNDIFKDNNGSSLLNERSSINLGVSLAL